MTCNAASGSPKRSRISSRTIFELQITARSEGLAKSRRSIPST
jgi:hypothetical protein